MPYSDDTHYLAALLMVAIKCRNDRRVAIVEEAEFKWSGFCKLLEKWPGNEFPTFDEVLTHANRNRKLVRKTKGPF